MAQVVLLASPREVRLMLQRRRAPPAGALQRNRRNQARRGAQCSVAAAGSGGTKTLTVAGQSRAVTDGQAGTGSQHSTAACGCTGAIGVERRAWAGARAAARQRRRFCRLAELFDRKGRGGSVTGGSWRGP